MTDIRTVKHIINHLDLADWSTTRNIIAEISDKYGIEINAREWRQWVSDYNANYIENGGRRWFVASSNKGYCRTRRKELIRSTVNRRRNRLYHEWKKANALLRAIGEDANERMEFYG